MFRRGNGVDNVVGGRVGRCRGCLFTGSSRGSSGSAHGGERAFGVTRLACAFFTGMGIFSDCPTL